MKSHILPIPPTPPTPPFVSAVITAGGRGRRFDENNGHEPPKQFQLLGGVPILTRAVNAFSRLNFINEIIVSLPPEYIADFSFSEKVTAVVPGGADRQASVYEALKHVSKTADIVLIHDGVRPLVTERLIRDVTESVRQGYAAAAGIKATDTIKQTDGNGFVTGTPDRDFLWQIQTPQGFTYEVIIKSHELARRDNFTGTDDASLVEKYSLAPVKIVEGDRENIKITTKHDMQIAEVYLNK